VSDAPPGPGPDGIEEGKRLIRIGGDRGLSLADRISEKLQRLAWQTPLHSLRLRGRHPLKLITVADDPFAGDVDRGNALLDGRLSFRGEVRDFDKLNLAKPDFSKAFAEHLHGFAWLRDLSTVATRAQGAPVAEALMRLWLAQHGEKLSEPAWRADLWGRRILMWVAHAPLILSSADPVYRSAVLHALARGARHIDRAADRVAIGTPRVAAWCGVIAAGLMIPGGDPRRIFGEAGLQRALAGALYDDGGSIGRSPLGQLDLVMLLSQLVETYAARRADPPEFLTGTRTKMVSALLGVCHGDRGLGSWQGCAPLGGDTIGPIIEATGVRTRALRQAREWGYQRLANGATVVMMDAAPPPVARLIEGGCASTLAFEFSDGPHRVVVNCGGGRMLDTRLPTALGEALRTTAAHSTLVVGDSNSTAIHSDGTLGRGVIEVELSRQESDAASRIEASHDGYARRFGQVHRRTLALSSDGRDLRGEDSLLPVGAARRKQAEPVFAIRFHLAPGIEVTPTADGMAVLLRLPGNKLWQFRCRGGALAIEDSLWIDARGRPLNTQQLVVSGEALPGGTSVSWLFHKAR